VVDYILEEAAYGYSRIPFFFVFLLIAILLVQSTGWRLLLFQPLVAIGFEMFAHSVVGPWAAGRPLILPIACALSAAAGVFLVTILGDGPIIHAPGAID